MTRHLFRLSEIGDESGPNSSNVQAVVPPAWFPRNCEPHAVAVLHLIRVVILWPPTASSHVPQSYPKRGMQRIRIGFEDQPLDPISQTEPRLRYGQEVLLVVIVVGFVC